MGYSFKFKFSESDIDFNPKSGRFFNYNKFLINEFFNSNDEEMIVIMRVYKEIFGESAYKHVIRNYYWGWRNGNRTLSNVQHDRIVSIMPDLLNEKAKNNLEKIREEARYNQGLEDLVSGIKQTVYSYFYNQSLIYKKEEIFSNEDLNKIFSREINRANEVKNNYHSYVLNEIERNEMLSISKYIIFTKLKNQIEQISRDFNLFIPYIQNIRQGNIYARFYIRSFDLTIDPYKIKYYEINVPEIILDKINSHSQYKEISDKYLANELVQINRESNLAKSEALLNAYDLELFSSHYMKILQSDNEAKLKYSFEGESGKLYIQASIKSIKVLKTSLTKSIVKIILSITIVAFIIYYALINGLFLIILLLGIFVGKLYFSFLFEEIKIIKGLKQEIKQHGKQ